MPCDLFALLKFAKDQGASDLHLSAGMPPILRIHGEMVRVKMDPLSREDTLAALRSVMTDGQRKTFEQKLDLDFALVLETGDHFEIAGRGTQLEIDHAAFDTSYTSPMR